MTATPTLKLAEALIQEQTVSPVTDADAYDPITAMLEEHGTSYTLHEHNGVYSLTAETGNGDAPRICLNGHLDVVPPGNGWTVTDPFDPVVANGKLYGRGAADMKGGLAAQVQAFIDLHEDDEFDGRAVLMVSGDEEIGSHDGTARLVEQFPRFDYAIIGEPTDHDIQIGYRGLLWPTVTLHGESVHASRPHLADNVMTTIPSVLEALNGIDLPDSGDGALPAASIEPTTITADGPQNSTPSTVEIALDIRYGPGLTPDDILQRLRDALDPLDVDYSITYEDHGRPYMLDDQAFRDVVTETVAAVTGTRPEHRTDGGISDGKFFARTGTPHIELGPRLNASGHQVDEHCFVEDLALLRECYHRIAKRLAAETTAETATASEQQ